MGGYCVAPSPVAPRLSGSLSGPLSLFLIILYHLAGEMSTGRLHKVLGEKLCNLLILRNSARFAQERAAEHKENGLSGHSPWG